MDSAVTQNLKAELLNVSSKLSSQLSVKNLVVYLVEGIAIAIAAYVLTNKRGQLSEIATIALIASLTLFLLDVFANDVGKGVRLGAGIGIGLNLANNAPVTLPFM